MKKDNYGRKVERRSNGIIVTEVVPIALEITCFACHSAFKKTLDFPLESRCWCFAVSAHFMCMCTGEVYH